MNPKRIKPWHVWVTALLVGVGVALFLLFRNSEPEATGADPERNLIYQSGLAACTERAQDELASSQAGISDAAIQSYCECSMTEVVTQLTDAEIELFYQTERLSDETKVKTETAAEACAQRFLQD